MELRVLRYFLAVAREGSFTRAANVLHVTQPTLSRQLMDLEYEVGQQLLVRGKQNVSLTPEGMLLRKRAEEILSLVQMTEAEFKVSGEDIGGDVYIGGGESRAMALIAQTIKEVQDRHANVYFHLYSGNAEAVMERLDKGLLDFGVLIEPVNISKYDSFVLPVKDVWGLVMPKDAPLARQDKVSFDDLAGLPLLVSRQILNRKTGEDGDNGWFGKHLDGLKVVASYNLIFNAALLVEAGVGYALTLDKLVDIQAHSELVFRPLEPKVESELYLVWKKQQVFSKAAQLFLDSMQKNARTKT